MIEGVVEALGRDRLQEVVDGVDLEGAQRIAVERRDEDVRRDPSVSEGLSRIGVVG